MRKVTGTAAAVAVCALVTGAAALGPETPGDVTASAGPYGAEAAAEATSFQTDGQVAVATPSPKVTGAAKAAARQRRQMVGVHGEATVRAKGGTFTERTWQRGAVTAKTDTTLTVKSKDGASWTWAVAGSTRIRRAGDRADMARLAVGDRVLVIGTPRAPGQPEAGKVVARAGKGL
ncbi:DUF5666 domain-containing protein [Microbispora sp. NPDC049125]|uniref:DUF5666 domain-containing protein n=1 Tax=Microbispora sp. NPDC049125 TaxID=3154929 RepID=UPI0034676756